VKLGEEVVC